MLAQPLLCYRPDPPPSPKINSPDISCSLKKMPQVSEDTKMRHSKNRCSRKSKLFLASTTSTNCYIKLKAL